MSHSNLLSLSLPTIHPHHICLQDIHGRIAPDRMVHGSRPPLRPRPYIIGGDSQLCGSGSPGYVHHLNRLAQGELSITPDDNEFILGFSKQGLQLRFSTNRGLRHSRQQVVSLAYETFIALYKICLYIVNLFP